MDLIFDPPELGCVLHLPGLPNGGSTILDRSPYGNHGTLGAGAAAPTWARLPSGLWYLDFDGGDKILCGNHILLQVGGSDYTVEVWFKPTNAAGWQAIISKSNVQYKNRYSLGIKNSGIWAFKEVANDGGIQIGGGTVTSTAYHHGVLTMGSAGYKVYLDGILADSSASTTTPASGTYTELQIGWDVWSEEPWRGSIALPRIYNRILSALEIQNHYQREKHLFGVV